MSLRKLLYVGPMSDGGTCRERAHALEGQGYSIISLDTAPYLEQTTRVIRALENRFLWGPNIIALNKALVNYTTRNRNIEVIWIDKARWIFPDVLEKVKKETGAICIHYTPDPAFTLHTSRHFAMAVPLFDLCVTTKNYELQTYRDHGAKHVLFSLQGIDDRFIRLARSPKSQPLYGSVFVGHCEPHYINVIKAAASVDSELHVYGSGWRRALRASPTLLGHVKAEGVWGDIYPRTLSLAKIGLGLLCKYYPDQFTTRTFEVPAAGAMLLAERTEAHQELFAEGVEADYFSSIDEMKEKLRFYLANEPVRMKMATAGQERCLNEYHWRKVLLPVLKWMKSART